MQSIEQHYYRETEEQNSNGCKLLVKKDAMLDSLDARERSCDNSANGINITIRKVNHMFVFIVVVWIFFFSKYMIQNPMFFCVCYYVVYCLRNCLVGYWYPVVSIQVVLIQVDLIQVEVNSLHM